MGRDIMTAFYNNAFEAVSQIDDVNKYDIKLDYCITPETIYQF